MPHPNVPSGNPRFPQVLRRTALPLLAAAALGALAGCAMFRPVPPAEVLGPGAADAPPAAPREFRGVWVASVANIDWPSRPGLPAAEQRAETVAILDRTRALRLNAVILQVRPAADALYPSALEPWSEYLTGAQGRPPEPAYDPLKFWIEQAHRRGIELHAWFNPYRARHQTAKSPLAGNHIARTIPGAVKSYGELLWMDPGDPIAARRTLEVVSDVVRRYDVDGVHIDDYFYPYPIKAPGGAAEVDFPDEPTWQAYLATGGKLSRADWRRQNVDRLVEALHRTAHEIRPAVKFGVSPFGLGRPDRRPPGVEGFSQFDKLYADVERWLAEGWMDYLAPQIYWPRATAKQPFAPLLDYWIAQNTAGRHVWPGLFTSAINDTEKSWSADEIVREVELVRSRPAAAGHIHFSMAALMQDRKRVATRLGAETYQEDALLPATLWLDAAPPPAPKLELRRAFFSGRPKDVRINAGEGEAPALFAVWLLRGGRWMFSVQAAGETTVNLASDAKPGAVEAVVVSSVDRTGNESPRVAIRLGRDGGASR